MSEIDQEKLDAYRGHSQHLPVYPDMKSLYLVIVAAAVGLSGCVVVPEYPAAQVIITGGGGGYHCPPGQAKKGRC